jgi:release factor glutamine methyltransferase
MNSTEWTIKRLLDWTADYFQQHGTAQPRLDAEVLLAEALHCERISLYTRFDETVDDEARSRFRGWVKRHADGEPVAYLVGHREFFSMDFVVNSHVLIPRPETEHLVTEALDIIKGHFANKDSVRIVDVGTGSGCIAIAIAKHCAKAKVEAVDVSPDALQVAKENIARLDVGDQVRLVKSDLLTDVDDVAGIDIFVSNPPYIGQMEREELAASVKDFEPSGALFAPDERGVEISRRLFEQFSKSAAAGAFLVVESNENLARELAKILDADGHDSISVKKDIAGLDRWIVARKAG